MLGVALVEANQLRRAETAALGERTVRRRDPDGVRLTIYQDAAAGEA
jgi:hypothetical protein